MSEAADFAVLDDKLLHSQIPTEPPGDPCNPFPSYEAARRDHPVQIVQGKFGPDGPPVVFVYRYADAVAVLRDDETYSSKITHDFMSAFMGEYVLPGMDGLAHKRYRALLAPAFRPKMLARWEEGLVGTVADQLIDRFASRGSAELVAEFNFSFPAQVIGKIIGVPQEDFAKFQRWAVDIVGGISDPAAGVAASAALRQYLVPFVEERRRAPKDDFISELVTAESEGDRLSDDEIYSFLLTLLPAGVETTFRSLGSLMFNLLQRPEQFAMVLHDRSLVLPAFEENLRMDAPFQSVPRLAMRDVEVGGVAIPAGAIVVPVIGSANRDPAFIEDPERFDVTRPAIRHVSFGNGLHFCMGLHLARMETRIAVNRLMDRLPGLRFDHDRAQGREVCIKGKMFRSPTALPVLWDA